MPIVPVKLPKEVLLEFWQVLQNEQGDRIWTNGESGCCMSLPLLILSCDDFPEPARHEERNKDAIWPQPAGDPNADRR